MTDPPALSDDVRLEVEGGVAVVRIDRPSRHNALGGTVLRDLAEAFEWADGEDEIGAILTTGQGSIYCPGGDVSEFAAAAGLPPGEMINGTVLAGDKGLRPLSPIGRQAERLGLGRWVKRMLDVEKPTVAALNGAAVGGGLCIALLHDFRWAAAGAKLGSGFIGLGLGPEMGISYLLPRLVGWPAATDLLLRPRLISAEEAADVGLVDRVLEPDELLPGALELAAELAALPPLAARLTKRALRESAENGFEQQLELEWRNQYLLIDQPSTRQALADLAPAQDAHREDGKP